MFRVRGISNSGMMPVAAADLTELLVTLCRVFPEPVSPNLPISSPAVSAAVGLPPEVVPWPAPLTGAREGLPQSCKDAA